MLLPSVSRHRAIPDMFMGTTTSLLLGVAASAVALPNLHSRAPVTPLTDAQIASFKPYTLFARAANCAANSTKSWSCGAACDALPGFIPYATGTSVYESYTSDWYVGYYPPLQSVIVSNQGMDPSLVLGLLLDPNVQMTSLNALLFPSVDTLAQAEPRFQLIQASSAAAKLSAVKKALSEHQTTQVTLTGHSLGGAVSLLDALFLELHLPSTKLRVVTYGMPRVGNLNFADLIDSHITDLSRINNKHDMIPLGPLPNLGYHHPSGQSYTTSSL
ncbi:hypothetical protein FS749_001191 [Ceratobasidium sp. UAMH 11750]|nr:hypothetical protein FS749_001191 [Ceratobasidium sp. UAMH 11750]